MFPNRRIPHVPLRPLSSLLPVTCILCPDVFQKLYSTCLWNEFPPINCTERNTTSYKCQKLCAHANFQSHSESVHIQTPHRQVQRRYTHTHRQHTATNWNATKQAGWHVVIAQGTGTDPWWWSEDWPKHVGFFKINFNYASQTFLTCVVLNVNCESVLINKCMSW